VAVAIPTDSAPADRALAAAALPGKDSDHDGLSDDAEVRRYHTDPRKRDTDRDGLSDGEEILRYHTNPLERDSDGDGYGDRAELRQDTDPRAPRSRPGFPGADNTGVPAGTTLTAYSGPSTIKTPNTVIDGKTLGCIDVSAPGVVIRNSKISCADGYAVYVDDKLMLTTRVLIEDSEIDCKNGPGTAVGEAHVTVRRVNVHGCENGFDLNQNTLVENSYIHDLFQSASAHPDGIQFTLGHWTGSSYTCCSLNITIRHNTIYATSDAGVIGNAAIISNRRGDENILIENNLLAGGGYTLYCEQDARGTNYRVLNNHFSTRFSPRVGQYGPATSCADETQSGNVIHETGLRVRLG
jgi:hypothetical protein